MPNATAPTGESLLSVAHLSVTYGTVLALDDISFAIGAGEVVALVGANGAGKSTLLKALAGQIRHTGEVIIHGHSCHHLDRHVVGYIPQVSSTNHTFPIRVRDVVLGGRRRFGRMGFRPRRADLEVVESCLDRVGLSDLAERPLSQLSGGQQQRVMLARALAQEADILLLDEAASGVDEQRIGALIEAFNSLATQGKSVLISSHNVPFVKRHFSRCIGLNTSLLVDGDPKEVLGADTLEGLLSK
ncbi:MAG: metal ABC transporter ATP-binding protein [SAR202 cluster bacterium]|nr:metal ABC transporter ATP-binding protein [SAR202 cluster bacterium]